MYVHGCGLGTYAHTTWHWCVPRDTLLHSLPQVDIRYVCSARSNILACLRVAVLLWPHTFFVLQSPSLSPSLVLLWPHTFFVLQSPSLSPSLVCWLFVSLFCMWCVLRTCGCVKCVTCVCVCVCDVCV